jgi:lipopolysaccharide assembly protein B
MNSLWLFLLPVAATAGWFSALRAARVRQSSTSSPALPRDYLQGLNYLLNEEPDKAVDLFIKMLDIDSDTVETHLALGNLFRRRGEVDRAIRIHQNLIARPTLQTQYKMQAILALARDYLSAGVLDRAERLFLELLDLGQQVNTALTALLSIYEQEKAWQKAIDTAKRMRRKNADNRQEAIAHYYCELGEQALKERSFDRALGYAKTALGQDKKSTRANLLFGKTYRQTGQHALAIRHLKRVHTQNSADFSQALPALAETYEALDQPDALIVYLKRVLQSSPKMPAALQLISKMAEEKEDKALLAFIVEHVHRHPCAAGLHYLIELQLDGIDSAAKTDFAILHQLAQKLQAVKPDYQCTNCGFSANDLHWHCPSCKRWNVIKPLYLSDAH